MNYLVCIGLAPMHKVSMRVSPPLADYA